MSLFNNILNELDGDSVYGLTPELKGLFLYKKFKKENKSIICVTSTIYEANKLYQILLNYTDKVSFFPMDDFLTSEALAISPEFKFTRLDTLNTLLEEKRIIITNLIGFLRFLPSPKDYKNSYSKIKLGYEIKIEDLVSNLEKENITYLTIVSNDIKAIKKELGLKVIFEDKTKAKFINNISPDILIEKLSKFKIDKLLIEEVSIEDLFIEYYK